MNSGSYKFFFSSWMYDLSIYCGSILVLTWTPCSIRILLKRGVYILFVLWFA